MLTRITALSVFPLHKHHYQNQICEPDSKCELSDNVYGGPLLQKKQKGTGYEGDVEPDVTCRPTKEGTKSFLPRI